MSGNGKKINTILENQSLILITSGNHRRKIAFQGYFLGIFFDNWKNV